MLVGSLFFASIVAASVALVLGAIAWAVWLLLGDVTLARVVLAIGVVGLSIAISSSAIFKGLHVEPQEMTGIILRKKEAPRLFETLDRLARTLEIPSINRVLLTEEFNASVMVVPKGGVSGGVRTTVAIGLPLLQVLSPQQLTSVLAHELGHLSGQVNQFQRRVWAHHAQWMALYEHLCDERGMASFLVRFFARWYVPRLMIMTFAMRRALEFEADKLAGKLVGNLEHGQALALVEVHGHLLETQVWPTIHRLVLEMPSPPDKTFFDLGGRTGSETNREIYFGWMQWQMIQDAQPGDTHPCLRERLMALGLWDEARSEQCLQMLLPQKKEIPSVQFFFEPAASEEFAQVLSLTWRNAQMGMWRETFEEARGGRSELALLENRAAAGEVTMDELLRMGRLTEAFVNRRSAYRWYRDALERDRTHADASFHFGRVIVEEGDEAGLPFLEFAMEAEPLLVARACESICAMYFRAGERHKAVPYMERVREHRHMMFDAVQERSVLESDDEMEPHEMPDAHQALIRRRLVEMGFVERAWIARKRVRHFPNHPVFVLGLEFKKGVPPGIEEHVSRLMHWSGVRGTLIVTAMDERQLRRRLTRIANSPLLVE